MATRLARPNAARLWPVGLVLALPLLGLAVLLIQPELDMAWEHHPSHFWIVLIAAGVNVALAYVTNVAAGRYRDARLALISLAFLSSAGFLALHALVTPGVLLDSPNIGFAIATPVGLIIASVFAAASATPLAGPRAMDVLRVRALLLGGLIALMVAWAVFSVARLPPLDGPPPPREGGGIIDVLSIIAIALFAFAAVRLTQFFLFRHDAILLATAAAVVLLAEALIAILVSQNWHYSWWEWHVLLLAAFLTIALAARNEYRRRGSLTGAFGGLYLEATLARVDRWYASAVASVAGAQEAGGAADDVLAQLGREGATDEELRLLTQTAREVSRLDDSFRPYLPAVVTEGIRRSATPSPVATIGDERVVTVMFADLAGFTPFSERHESREVVQMLNTYWAAVVPIVDRAGGTIESFAGDGVLAIFNAVGDQPDHARRAAGAAIEILLVSRDIALNHPGWPLFRIGVNTGPAVVGVIGTAARRSFAAIGDPVNTGARLQTAAEPGQAVVGRATWEALDDATAGVALGPIRVKGKRDPVEAWRLTLPG
ncbi:MAG: adenylate/guanylate cyclase domain-containing protein [Chloroflexota bacterium]